MFTQDAPLRRLWRRVTRRYPRARGADCYEPVVALYRQEAEGAYALLKALSEHEGALGLEQVRAYLVQGSALHRQFGGEGFSAPFFLGVLATLNPVQSRRWWRYGLFLSESSSRRAYFSGSDPQAQRVLQALQRGCCARGVARVLRFYAEALTEGGVRLRFSGSERAPAALGADVLWLPERVAAFLPAEDGRDDPNFGLYKWLITHEWAHREAGTYRCGGAATPAEGHAALSQAVRAFADPYLAETLFHLFEDVRVEAHLLRQYPGFKAERARLLALEFPFRPTSCLAGREALLEALAQRLHWGKTRLSLPPEREGWLDEWALRADSLRSPSSAVEHTLALVAGAYWQLDELFPAAQLDAPWTLALFPHEPALHLHRPPGAARPPVAPPRVSAPAPGEPGEEGLEADGLLPPLRAHRYDEWDYRAGAYRPAWCALHERPPAKAAALPLPSPAQVSRVRRSFEWMAEEDWSRQQRQLEGDELDLEAWVQGAVDRRVGLPLPEKLYTQRLRKRRDLCAAVLLDQSDSTARLTPGGRPVIELEREALGYLCEALEALRDEYALYSYSGEGRAGVQCFCLKGFEEPLGPTVRRRLAALRPLSQNRDGCALRHLARVLQARPARTKLLLHLTDGRPWDQAYQQRYAWEDTKKAVQEARSRGIKVFGVVCDPHAPATVKATYGGRAVVLSKLDDLSDLLLGVYRRITW